MSGLKLSIKKTLVFLNNKFITLLFFFSLRVIYIRFLGNFVGKGVAIHNSIYFFDFKRLRIGDFSTINNSCYIDNRFDVVIGSNVNISHDCKIYTVGHDINDEFSSLIYSKVTIGDNAWIFPHAIIMPGVSIGPGAVIYPGSLVTKDVPDFEVWGGNPAKFIKKRNRKISYKLDNRVWFLK